MWERAANLEWWLKEYGKGPDEVLAMPAWFVARAPAIADVRNEVLEAKQREAQS